MNRATDTSVRRRTIATEFGIALALLSLTVAIVGFFLYYTIESLDANLFKNVGFQLSDIWKSSGLLLLAAASLMLLGGPARKGDQFSVLAFLSWGLLVVSAWVTLAWLFVAGVTVSHVEDAPFGDPDSYAQVAAWLLTAALLAAAARFDFRRSQWVQSHRKALSNSIALLIGLILAGALGELAMRHIFRPPVFSPLLVKSSILAFGFQMKPNFDGPCGNVHVQLNSAGLRSPEISAQKMRKRLLTIGDSVTFGAWVEQEKVWPTVLQLHLGTDTWEVINAGTPAYHLEQVAAFFEHQGVRYQPDIVIYTFVYDDINDPLILDDSGALLQEPSRRYGEKVAVADRYRFIPLPQSAVFRSRLLMAVLMRYYHFRESRHVSGERDLLPDLMAERWGWLEKRLLHLRDRVEKSGARFLLVVFPVGLSKQSVERLVTMARENKIEALELRSVLGDSRTYAAKYMTAFDAHPNADAHALMARAIYDRLVAARFLGASVSSKSKNGGEPKSPPSRGQQ